MFEWNENFSVKVPFLDDQHKKLFEIGERINELLLDHNGEDSFDDIMDQIDELESYTSYHFEEEEKMMKYFGYPELESHIQEHQKFINYLRSIDVIEVDGNQLEMLTELVRFIAKWIFGHINSVDFLYSDYMIENR